MRMSLRWTTRVGAVASLALLLAAGAAAASKQRYMAIIDTQDGPPVQVIAAIKDWTTDQEAAALKTALASGPDAAEKAMRKIDKGYLSFVGSLGWQVNVAKTYPTANGGQRIVLVTDRPIMFSEALSGSSTLNYPFGIVELQVDSTGKGTGSVIGMARISMDDKGVLKVDPYAGYAYELLRVRLQK